MADSTTNGKPVADSTTVSPDQLAESISEMKFRQIEEEVASSYILIDIGANLTSSKYSRDLDSVIERAKDAGVKLFFSNFKHCLIDFAQFEFIGVRKIMVTGASIQCSKEALRLTRLYPGTLYSTAGW